MVRKVKTQKMRSSYGFVGNHKIKPMANCWNCNHYNGLDKNLLFIVNDDIPRADCTCPSCGALMPIFYDRLDEFVDRLRIVSPSIVLKAIRVDQALRGKLPN